MNWHSVLAKNGNRIFFLKRLARNSPSELRLSCIETRVAYRARVTVARFIHFNASRAHAFPDIIGHFSVSVSESGIIQN